ncbi:UDP binding domain-containing protein [Acinetobacter johnsonii]|uniref:UDP binding domain-containing protein n=1 Tax=Acinetobacter johnsonii TaxID=40214 RepID=UPI001F4497D1|nr:UDP binding domain-containing protein [Acinetobacter johnsonii]UIP94970.1 UDP-glucose 6-dehydrogenase [Acinetobacter johnsonii]
MKIAMFGTTLYAGVISSLLAESGHQVFICNDLQDHTALFNLRDQDVVRSLKKQHKSGFLSYCDFAALPLDIDAYFFSFNPAQEGEALGVAKQLKMRTIIHPKLMINASTFGLNGTEKLKAVLTDDHWVYFPDIIQEGQAFKSVTSASKVIIGCADQQAQDHLEEMLRPIFPRPQQYLFMPVLDAEFTKLSISGMLATRISYMNDLADVAEKLGIDIAHVRDGMAADSRIGESYLYSGAGFGGENFSHDILTLSHTISNTGTKSQLLGQVWDINEQQKEFLFRKLWNYYHGNLAGKTIAIWGAAFKQHTSSTSFSPIHPMLAALWAQGVTVRLHDPQALEEIHTIYGERDNLILCEDQYDAVNQAHGLCVLTAWKQYWSLDYTQLKLKLAHPLILDGRNIYQPDYVKSQGFAYMGVGR